MASEVGKLLGTILLIAVEKSPGGVTLSDLVDATADIVTKEEVIQSLKGLAAAGKIDMTDGKRITLKK